MSPAPARERRHPPVVEVAEGLARPASESKIARREHVGPGVDARPALAAQVEAVGDAPHAPLAIDADRTESRGPRVLAQQQARGVTARAVPAQRAPRGRSRAACRRRSRGTGRSRAGSPRCGGCRRRCRAARARGRSAARAPGGHQRSAAASSALGQVVDVDRHLAARRGRASSASWKAISGTPRTGRAGFGSSSVSGQQPRAEPRRDDHGAHGASGSRASQPARSASAGSQRRDARRRGAQRARRRGHVAQAARVAALARRVQEARVVLALARDGEQVEATPEGVGVGRVGQPRAQPVEVRRQLGVAAARRTSRAAGRRRRTRAARGRRPGRRSSRAAARRSRAARTCTFRLCRSRCARRQRRVLEAVGDALEGGARRAAPRRGRAGRPSAAGRLHVGEQLALVADQRAVEAARRRPAARRDRAGAGARGSQPSTPR